MEKEARSVPLLLKLWIPHNSVVTVEPEWGDQDQSLQGSMEKSAGDRFCVTVLF